jgi:hypothetical protein
MRLPRSPLVLFTAASLFASSATGCSSEASSSANAAAGDEQDQTSDAAPLRLTGDFQTAVTGEAAAGKGIRVEYALERLPRCRGNVGGGGPGWNATGFYSENGGAPKTFEVSALTPDGKDRVAKAARIVPSAGGDVAIWFQVSSAGASVAFDKDGNPTTAGELKAGGKVKVTSAQERLPQCRRVEHGNPVWTITRFAQIDREAAHTFDTARPEGSDRKEIEALVDLPHAGELSLWFRGCTSRSLSSRRPTRGTSGSPATRAACRRDRRDRRCRSGSNARPATAPRTTCDRHGAASSS